MHSDRMVGVRGREDIYGWQAIQSPDRLTRPLVRESGRLARR